MGFNLDSWKAQIADYFKSHAPLIKQTGADTLYGLLAAGALLPAIGAYQGGEVFPVMMALSELLGSVGGNLIANLIQGWKDKTDAEIAHEVLGTAQKDAKLRQAVDVLLKELDVVSSAQQAVSDADKLWFVEALQVELEIVGSTITIDAINAITEGGSVINGNVTASTFIARDQWNIYLSAAGRGRLSEEDFQKILNSYLVWVGNTNNKARLWGLESLQVTGDRPVRSLSDVFVPLSLCRFTPPRRDEVEELVGQSTNGLERNKAYLRLVEARQHEGQDIDLQALLTSKNRLAVIGGPG